ncbi:MAG TPA: ATP-binding protein [Candidatus Saccharimonadales bacterium]|nr:ATP-binding protein [Candidatus Saccharimonadales bacterium]
MNDAMHLVAKGWYRLYWGVLLVMSAVAVAGFGLTQSIPALEQYGLKYGFTLGTAVFAGMQLLYSLTIFWIVWRRSQPLAMVVSSMFFTIVLLAGLSATDPGTGAWLYVGMWLGSSLFIGIYGLPFALGTVLMAFIYTLLHSDFEFTLISTQSLALVGGTSIIAPLSYLFWKNRFINPAEAELSQLSGKLKTNQEQSAILIQSIADGVIVTDTSGKISLMNRAAANMTGWAIDEAGGVDVKSVLKVAKEKGEPISDQEYPFTAVLVHKAFINQVLQLTSRKGRKQVVSLVISPVVTSTGQVYGAVAVMRDISAQRAAEQQRAEFISTASHEMRTPVAAIEGYLSLALNEKVSTIDSRAHSYLDKAHASTQHLGKLFQDLLTSAKAEDGRLSSHPQLVEMGDFLEQLIEDLRFTAQKKNLLAEFVVGTTGETIDATKSQEHETVKVVKPLYYTYADPERLREVITNLFDNAIKYTDQGKITVGLTGNSEVVQVYIKDTGQGIPAEDIPHLFQKFYRVDNSATRVIGGTGLGLFISRKIIELYNGRIWVESELGKGSTFYINLPRMSTQKAAALQAQQTAISPVSTTSASTNP